MKGPENKAFLTPEYYNEGSRKLSIHNPGEYYNEGSRKLSILNPGVL